MNFNGLDTDLIFYLYQGSQSWKLLEFRGSQWKWLDFEKSMNSTWKLILNRNFTFISALKYNLFHFWVWKVYEFPNAQSVPCLSLKTLITMHQIIISKEWPNFLHLWVLEQQFSWDCFNNSYIFRHLSLTSCHLYPLQVENCDSNSRLVVDEDDNGKSRLGSLNIIITHQTPDVHP